MPIILDDFGKSLIGEDNPAKGIKLDDFGKKLLNSAPSSPQIKTAEPPAINPAKQSPQDALPLGQRILTNPIVDKVISTVSGGMSPEEAQGNADYQVQRIKQLPQDALTVGKNILNAGNPFHHPDPQEFVDTAGKAMGIASLPFMPAYQSVVAGLQALIDEKPVVQGAFKGALAPQSVPLFTGPERMPLNKMEREGSTAALIPRAIVNSVEQLVMGHLILGNPIGKAYGKAKIEGVQRDFESDFSKINPADVQAELEKQGLFSPQAQSASGATPRELTPQEKADMTAGVMAHLKNSLKNNPKVGDYYGNKQTPIKLAKDFNEQLGERGQLGGLPEGNKIPNDRQENIVRDQTGAPKEEPVLPIESIGGVIQPSATPERWKEIVDETKKAKAKDIIEQAGGKFKAVTDQANSLYDNEPTIYYDTPSGSTQTIRPSELSVENVKAKIDKFEQAKLQSSSTMPPIGQPSNTPTGLEPPQAAATPLHAEALKYKTAEEFVQSKKPMYQGGGKEFKIEGRVGGVYLTTSKKYADSFKGKNGEIAEAYAEPKKPYDLTDQIENQPERELLIEAPQNFPSEIAGLKKKGYDAITYKDQVLVLDPSIVKTKSQLTAIYNEAHGSLKPPAEPPTITAVSPGPEEQPQFTETSKTEPTEFKTTEATAEQLAEIELEIANMTDGLHPLEHAMKDIGKIRSYRDKKEMEEHKEIPFRFRNTSGMALDEVRDELNSRGWDFQSDGDLRMALKELGNKPKRFVMSKATQAFFSNKKTVEKMAKALDGKIPAGKIRRIINSNAGVLKTSTPLDVSEEKMLKRVIQAQAKGAKFGFKAAKEEGKKDRSAVINELKNTFNERMRAANRRAELSALEKDIRDRYLSTAEIAQLKKKYEEKISEIKRAGEMDLLKADIQARDEQRGNDRAKKMVADYVKANLPKEVQGKYITEIFNAKSYGDVVGAFRRADKELSNIQRKEIIKEIREESKKALESGKVAVDYKKMIEEITGGIELSKRRPETLDRLRKTREYIEAQREKGKDVEMPDRIMKQLEILNRRTADQLTIGELKNIVDNIKDLAKLGETKQSARENIYAMQKERITNDLISGTVALEKNPLIMAEPGEKLTPAEKFKNVFGQLNQFLQHLDLVITPMDTYFDLLDGGKQKFDGPNYRHIKKMTDTNYQSYLKMANKYVDQALMMAKDLKLDDQNFERIGIHAARMQKDGIRKLIDTGLTQAQIDKIELTDDEMKFYKMMRKSFDELRPQVAETMREVYNQPLGEVDNYVSFMTDFSKMSDTEIYRRVGENAVEVKRPSKTPEKGFTKERTGGTQAIKLNAMDIYLRHIDNVSYLVNMARDNKMLFEVINSPEYGKVAGDLGQRMALEWIDTISRKGGLAGEQRIAILDILRRNFGLAQLGLNVTSALIQPTALLDGAAVLGNYAFDGAYKVIADADVRKFVLDNMTEIKNRIGDDPAFLDFGENKFMSKMSEIGFAPLKFFDGITAMGVAHGAYLKKMKELGIPVDLEKPNKEAISYAQSVVRQTQSSSLFKDAPPAIARGKLTGNRSFDKALLQFQSFMLTRWNIMRNYIWRANIMGGRVDVGKSRDFKKAFLAIGMLTLALIAETQARRGIRAAQDAITGKMKNKNDSTFSDDFVQNVVTTVPFVSQGVSMAVYRGDAIPSFTGVRKVGEGVAGLVQAGKDISKGKEITNKSKLIVNTAAGAGALLGIPGTAQISKSAKSEIDSNTKANITTMYRDAIMNNDPALTKKADKIANEKGYIVEDLERNAMRSIHKEITDLYEDAMLRNDPKITAKADALAKKAGLEDDEIADLEDAAARRIDKAQENKGRLDEQQSEYRKNQKSPLFDEAKKLMQELQGANN